MPNGRLTGVCTDAMVGDGQLMFVVVSSSRMDFSTCRCVVLEEGRRWWLSDYLGLLLRGSTSGRMGQGVMGSFE